MSGRPEDSDRARLAASLARVALGLGGADRSRFLESACGADAALRAEVEALVTSPQPSDATEPLGTVVAARPAAEGDGFGLAPGSTIAGRYAVHEELGSGGMGRVYRATDLTFGRAVAVKVLTLSGDSSRGAFEAEARLLNALRHRSLPVVTDYFTAGRHCCLVMDYVPGVELGSLAAARAAAGDGPLEVGVVLDWADQVLDALCYLGSFDPPIVHRDIKPQNIRLTPRGDVMLLDFGLAKGDASDLGGQARSVPGYTPRYAPIEQVRGGGTDPRSDLYSLGVTLHYLLTGQLAPDAGERASAVLGGAQDPLPRADAANPLVPPAVADVLRAATALALSDRPASARAMRDALRAARAGPPSAADEPREDPDATVRAARAGFLPQPVTGFVGREREVADVAARFDESRLVTVTGPGGIGKTRLALRVAAGRGLESWFVDFSTIADAARVPHALAAAVGVAEEPGRPALDGVVEFARGRPLLFVFDNCEHVVSGAADAAAALLRACPDAAVLATSRERLGLTGESVYPLGPLGLPPAGAPADDAGDAVRLFAVRARMARPDFALTERNARAIADICRKVEGIPLAIELAAARAVALSAEQIVALLDDRFALLSSRDRTAPSRQRTLRAAIDWSYDLLDDDERALLRRLSVIPGGCSIAAARAVATATLDVLSALVDKSLLRAEEREGEVRYRMLETVRDYAAGRLRESGEERPLRLAFFRWAAAFATEASPRLNGPEPARWLAGLDLEYDNLRAALAWAVEDAGPDAEPLVLAVGLAPYWNIRHHLAEGLGWLERSIERSPGADAGLRARAWMNAGAFTALAFRDHRRAVEYGTRSAEAARQAGLPVLRANALINIAISMRVLGDSRRATEVCSEALAEAERARDPKLEAFALLNLATFAAEERGPADAAPYLERALAIGRAMGNAIVTGYSATELARASLPLGDLGRAETLVAESLGIFTAAGDRRQAADAQCVRAMIALERGRGGESHRLLCEALEVGRELRDAEFVAQCIAAFAEAAYLRGAPERGLRLAYASAAYRASSGMHSLPYEAGLWEERRARLRETLGDGRVDAAVAAGRAMSIDEAAALAMRGDSDDTEANP